jgi:hypothetical protein
VTHPSEPQSPGSPHAALLGLLDRALRRDIEFRDPGPALAAEPLARFAAELGVASLPTAYEQFMRHFNGADPVVGGPARPAGRSSIIRLWWPATSMAADDGLWASLSDMYQLGTDPIERPELFDVQEVVGHLHPPQAFAFCGASGGSRFLFDLRTDRFGEVLFWSRMGCGSEETAARDPYHNVAWVAHDFIDFLNRIEVEPDDMAAWEDAQPPAAQLNWQPR